MSLFGLDGREAWALWTALAVLWGWALALWVWADGAQEQAQFAQRLYDGLCEGRLRRLSAPTGASR